MPLPRVHPWCCEETAYPVQVYMVPESGPEPWYVCHLPRCVTVTPYGLPEQGCCRCLRRSRLWYNTHHSWLPVYLPHGARAYMTNVHEWRGRGPMVCGLNAVSLLYGAIEYAHEYAHARNYGWVLVYHDGQFRDGLWVRLAQLVTISDCSEAPIRGVAPGQALGYATSPALQASCIMGHGAVVRPGFAIDWDDACVQSPERCVDPPARGELCRGGVPPGLIVRLWGPPAAHDPTCRLNGHQFILKALRFYGDVYDHSHTHGHSVELCENQIWGVEYAGAVDPCLPHVSPQWLAVRLMRDIHAPIRKQLSVELRIDPRSYRKRVGECEQLPTLQFTVDAQLFQRLPVSTAVIEPYYGPVPDEALSGGLFCAPRWLPPCPRPARLIVRLECPQAMHDGTCYARITGGGYVQWPAEIDGELDELRGCCSWRGWTTAGPVSMLYQTPGGWVHRYEPQLDVELGTHAFGEWFHVWAWFGKLDRSDPRQYERLFIFSGFATEPCDEPWQLCGHGYWDGYHLGLSFRVPGYVRLRVLP